MKNNNVKETMKTYLKKEVKDKALLLEMCHAIDDFDLEIHNDPIKRRFHELNNKPKYPY